MTASMGTLTCRLTAMPWCSEAAVTTSCSVQAASQLPVLRASSSSVLGAALWIRSLGAAARARASDWRGSGKAVCRASKHGADVSSIYQRARVPAGTGRAQRGRGMSCQAGGSNEVDGLEVLQVPADWTAPEAAAQEATWLEGALKRWLDEEYCIEPANLEISRRCARVYRHCLQEQQTDLAEILVQMIRDLEGFSFQESFHGAFSSANAAVKLISDRILVA